MSIKLKWVLAFLSLVAFTLGIEVVALTHWMKRDLEKHLLLRLREQTRPLASLVEQNLGLEENLKAASQLALTQQRFDPEIRVRVADQAGAIVFDSAVPGEPHGSMASQALQALGGVDETSWESEDEWHVAKPIAQLGQIAGVIECSVPESSIFPTLDLLRKALFGTILGAMAIAVLLAIVVSNTLVKPIRELEMVTREISKGDWDKRVGFHRQDELGQLADAVHFMAGELKSQFVQLGEEKTTLQALFSSMIDGLIVLDEKQNVKFLNPEAERSLRVKSEPSFGKPLDSIWPLQEVLDLVSRGLSQKKILSREISLPYNVLKVYIVPMLPAAGASGMLIFRDITEVRQLEKVRNEFLGQVSHELRTPLTIIKGYVVTLLDDPVLSNAAETGKILTRIEEEADRLTKLVEELLEFSKLRSGRGGLTFAPVPIKELAYETVESFRHHARRYDITLQFGAEGDIPQIMGDVDRLKQVLLNLLDNAVKYTPPLGNVIVSLSTSNRDVMLSISDNGYGIPKQDLPHIFERFFQGEKNAKGKGWGLGLPIVKEIVEAHGGHLEIDSQENVGTKVSILFPAGGLGGEKQN